MVQELISSIHWVSFGLGFAAAAILIGIVMAVSSWLKSVFNPPGSKPFGQRLAAAFRNLVTGLLVLAALVLIGYIVYTVWLKPAP